MLLKSTNKSVTGAPIIHCLPSPVKMTLAIATLFITCIVLIIYLLRKNSDVQHPPGPRGVPILGNLFQFGAVKPWKLFAKWKADYG